MLSAAISLADEATDPVSSADVAGIAFELVTDRASFDALEADWNDLFRRAGRGTQVFQGFNWNWHWCNHYLGASDQGGATPTLAVVTARRAGRLVMVWPLATEQVAGLRQLIWMGSPASQYGDILMEDGPDMAGLPRDAWNFIKDKIRPDLAWLRKVRDDALIAPFLAELGAVSTQRLEAPYIDLTRAADFEAHLQRQSPRHRKKQRAMAKRLAELGPVECARHSSGPAARSLARHAIELKRAQLQEGGIASPALADPRMADFFADAADGLGRPAGLNVVSLASNGTVAAINIYVGCKDRAALHIATFDTNFKKASVGTLLLEQSIGQSFADGYGTFDFLAPAEHYKLQLADGVVGTNDWVVPLSLKGSLFARVYLGYARPAIKGALAAMPMPLRRFLADRYAH
jgi:CelD/BcsL family acetyltransferase involved in cellulose biosynthesis